MRQRLNLPQDKMAEKCGVHRTYISLAERGLRSPTLDTIMELCRKLDMRPAEFMDLIESHLELDDK